MSSVVTPPYFSVIFYFNPFLKLFSQIDPGNFFPNLDPWNDTSKAGALYIHQSVTHAGALVVHVECDTSLWHRAPTMLLPFVGSRAPGLRRTQRVVVVGEPRRVCTLVYQKGANAVVAPPPLKALPVWVRCLAPLSNRTAASI
jgi:hypothetical protein